MRLLDTLTGQFRNVNSAQTVPYAVLSHVWDLTGEQSYQDILKIQESSSSKGLIARRLKHTLLTLSCTSSPDPEALQEPSTTAVRSILGDLRVSEKIRRACEVARSHGYRYIWIDSCCIDKTSSAELSEAINSMFNWYRDAAICYTYLADVPGDEDPSQAYSYSAFRCSKWFIRGWTLQELIAPGDVVFLSREWGVIGTKSSLALVVETITGIDSGILTHRMRLDDVSVARRMSWASNRETTREEDAAYCLLGIFDINMPTLYGEGRRAFVRLQEEILRRIPDQSLFAWGWLTTELDQDDAGGDSGRMLETYPSLFAPSPAYFRNSGLVRSLSHDELAARLAIPTLTVPEYTISPYGMRTQLPLAPAVHCPAIRPAHGLVPARYWCLVFLACALSDRDVLAVACAPDCSRPGITVLGAAGLGRMLVLPVKDLAACRAHVRQETVYLAPGYRAAGLRQGLGLLSELRPEAVRAHARVQLAEWTVRGLRERGCTLVCDAARRTAAGGVLVLDVGGTGRARVEIELSCRDTEGYDETVLEAFERWMAGFPRVRPEEVEKQVVVGRLPLRIASWSMEERCGFTLPSGEEMSVCVSVKHFPAVSTWLLEISFEEKGGRFFKALSQRDRA